MICLIENIPPRDLPTKWPWPPRNPEYHMAGAPIPEPQSVPIDDYSFLLVLLASGVLFALIKKAKYSI